MLIVISPAKRLAKTAVKEKGSLPQHLDSSEKLIRKLRRTSLKELQRLMHISIDLARLNRERYEQWSLAFNEQNSSPALFTFNGDVYRGIDAASFSKTDIEFATAHLRILSGLHGLLHPMDLIQPHRLEMGTRLSVGRKKNLYEFWSGIIDKDLQQAILDQGDDVLINLASAEYFKAVQIDKVQAKVITPQFLDRKNGKYKFIHMFGKIARGLMTRFIIKNKLVMPEELRLFDLDGYEWNEAMSSPEEPVFTRG